MVCRQVIEEGYFGVRHSVFPPRRDGTIIEQIIVFALTAFAQANTQPP